MHTHGFVCTSVLLFHCYRSWEGEIGETEQRFFRGSLRQVSLLGVKTGF